MPNFFLLTGIFLFSITLCMSQTEVVIKDTISGLYLTKSHDGFIVDNYETLVLEDKPYIYLSEIKEVSTNFDQLGRPVVLMTLNEAGKEKLKIASTKFNGEPLVIYFGKKIVLAPKIMSPITNGLLQISGNFTIQETDGMVNWIKNRIGKN